MRTFLNLLWISFLIGVLCCCQHNKNDVLKFKKDDPKGIVISSIKTGEVKTLTRSSEIKKIIDQLRFNKREFVVFMPTKRIEIRYFNRESMIVLSSNEYIKYNGVAYKLKEKLILDDTVAPIDASGN